jgi:hypothetical protein
MSGAASSRLRTTHFKPFVERKQEERQRRRRDDASEQRRPASRRNQIGRPPKDDICVPRRRRRAPLVTHLQTAMAHKTRPPLHGCWAGRRPIAAKWARRRRVRPAARWRPAVCGQRRRPNESQVHKRARLIRKRQRALDGFCLGRRWRCAPAAAASRAARPTAMQRMANLNSAGQLHRPPNQTLSTNSFRPTQAARPRHVRR